MLELRLSVSCIFYVMCRSFESLKCTPLGVVLAVIFSFALGAFAVAIAFLETSGSSSSMCSVTLLLVVRRKS